MAGCYGNHPFDRYFEGVLNRWLNSQDDFEVCDGCHYANDPESEDWGYDDETNELICPECGWRVKL